MLKLIAIQSNGDGDEEEGDGDEEQGNEIKDNDHSILYYCFSELPKNTTTKENETLLAIGTAFVQGEDVAARGHLLLFSVDKNPDNSQTLILRNAVSCVMIFYPSQVPKVYSKELKGAISALASLQGHLKGAISALASLQSLLLIASGPKISWFQRWTYGKRGKILDLRVTILNMKCQVFSVGHDSGFRLQKAIQIA